MCSCASQAVVYAVLAPRDSRGPAAMRAREEESFMCGLPLSWESKKRNIAPLAMSSGPPSQHSSHHVSTDQYSLSSSVCGSSNAGSEDKDSPMNTAEDITPEKMFPECILEIRLNNRLNLIAVDVRNGQTTRGLLRCTVLCGIKAKVQRSRSPSVDRHCQATFTSVMSGMQFHNSKRIHFNAASVAAMDIERQPASAARCANAAAARMRTETPALLKKSALTAATHTLLHHHPVQNGGRKKRQKTTPDNTELISALPELQFMNPDGRSCPEKAKGLLQLRRTLWLA
ncbi:hypothetical protein HPB47_002560 [Ixodes persulcatus]|uniref:Uncharacterized protein n=1 Tax=Ixodes persulcatus TaxID=34615 RepID=A0AC60PKW7_IXOPE|nr:hypothetical protein HPB47_002560 [Ixodes persulcatus]